PARSASAAGRSEDLPPSSSALVRTTVGPRSQGSRRDDAPGRSCRLPGQNLALVEVGVLACTSCPGSRPPIPPPPSGASAPPAAAAVFPPPPCPRPQGVSRPAPPSLPPRAAPARPRALGERRGKE